MGANGAGLLPARAWRRAQNRQRRPHRTGRRRRTRRTRRYRYCLDAALAIRG
jgi:hypothetical protein